MKGIIKEQSDDNFALFSIFPLDFSTIYIKIKLGKKGTKLDYSIIFDLAVILFACKVLSIFMRHIKVPQVVGQIVAGLLIGGNLLNIVDKNEPLDFRGGK